MSDTITINTTTESVNLTVIDGRFAYWGTIFGTLSTQTDLWRVLSAKALEVDLQSLSGQVIDLETFIATVSGTWNGGQEALTVLAVNSAFWDTAFARSTVFSSVSSRYDGSSTVTESNSGNWNYAYDTAVSYSTVSSTFAINSTVSGVSSLLTPLTLTNSLTGQLVLNTDFNSYKTDVASVTATLLPASTYQQTSGNWQGTFTNVQSNSANWDFGYDVATYVQANSANWEESAEIIPTVTNYLSTTPVTLSSTDVKGKLLSAGTDLFDIFLTSETESQTLAYTPSSYELSISNGNTVNLSSINTTFAANSGKYENVYSNVVSNSANWNTAFDRSTVFSNVSSRYDSSSTAVESNSANWDYAYNTAVSYSSVSSTFATNSALNLLAPPPTYIAPTAFITKFTTTTVEVGTTINQNLTLTWTQNDAGSFIPSALNKNNTLLTTVNTLPSSYQVNELATLTTTTYQLSVNFETGPIKNNILDNPDNRGQILAGSVVDATSFRGYYRRWIGSNATFPPSPSSIRTLGLTTSLDTNNTLATQSSPVFISNKFILIVIPNTKTLTTVITEANENLTAQFNLSSVQIPDAGSTLRDYKLYYLETAVPLNANLINVTLA